MTEQTTSDPWPEVKAHLRPMVETEQLQGIKHDEEKPRWSLLPARALAVLVQVYTFGAKKYSDRNWEKGMNYDKLIDAINRHMNAYWCGELYDPESGLHHMAHAAFSCLALVEYSLTQKGKDTRPYASD